MCRLAQTQTVGMGVKVTLGSSGYDWQFIPAGSGTFKDSGSGPCH